MSSTDHLSELESLRSRVADLTRALAERDHSMQDLREQSQLLRTIIEGTAAETGDEFFSSLVKHLTSTLHVQYAVIGEVIEGRLKKIRTLAVSAGGALADNFEYELVHTPCATALTQNFACFARDVQATFPQFQRLAELGVESYCAVPLRTENGAAIGLLVVMDTKPLQHGDYLQSLLGVFAPRVAVEFERRRAEQELTQALADLHNVMESVPDIMFTLDNQGNMVKWNHRVEEVTGYRPEELLNKPALAFVPPEEQTRTTAAIQQVFMEGYAELEGQMLTKDLSTIPYHWTGAALKDSDGRIIGIVGVGRDVSAKKRAEVELQHQRRHLVEAQALAHLGSWEWELDSGEVQWSDEQYRIFGHEPGAIAVTDDTFLTSLHPDDNDRALEAINDALLGKRPIDVECRIVRPDGKVRFIQVRGDVHRGATGHPLSMAGTVLDITDRKQTEEALRASEERWQLAVRGSNDGIWDWNVQTGEVYFSVRWKAMRGYEESELANSISEWQSRIHPDDLERVLQRIDQYLAKQTPEFREEYRVLRKDGSYMWILDRGMALWADDGTPLRMAGSETDVTERQRTEEALRESEERFALAVAGSSDILWDARRLPGEPWYAPQTPVWWSLRVRELLGLAEPESFETFEQWAVRLHPDDKDRVFSRLAAHIEHRVPYDVEYRLRTNAGDYLWIHGRGQALWDDQGEPRRMSGSCQDITDRKANEQLLAAEKRILEMIATDTPLLEVLTLMCRMVEERSPGAHCSILLLDPDGLHLRHGGAPSLPEAYIHAIDGVAIGPTVGSCGTAAFTRRQVIVSDIARDPLWADFRELALRHGLRACWSTPVLSSDGIVLGTFAVYYREPKQPTDADLQLIERANHSACIAIERKRGEEAIRGAELRYRTIFEQAGVGVAQIESHTGQFVQVNRQYCEILGLTEAEMLATTFGVLTHPDDLQSDLENMTRLLRGEIRSFTMEKRYVRPGGSIVWVNLNIAPLWGAGEQAIHHIAIVEDITERKRTEEALRKSEERYARATAVGKVGVWELDVATGTYYGDPNLKALFGYVGDELSTDPYVWLNLVHPDDQSIALDHWQRIVNGERDNYNYELRMLKKDGTVIWTDVRGHAVRDHEGQVTQLFGATVDISERKQVQDALVQSELQIHAVLDALPVGVWFTDRSGKPLLANPAAKQIWSNIKQIGLQTPDNQSSWWETIGPTNEPHRWALSRVLTTGIPSLGETFDLECLDGTKKVIRNSTVPVQSEAGVTLGAIVLNEDITMLRQAQAALQLTQFSVDHAIEGFFWIGPDAGIFHVNDAACRMLEYTYDELMTMTLHDIDPNLSSEVWPAHWEELKQKQSMTFETKFWSRTGRVLDTEVTVNYLQYEGREYNCAIMRDITERKQVAEREASHVRQLKKLYELSMTMSGDPGVVLEHAVRTIGELFNVQVVCLSEIVGQELYFKSVYVNGQTLMDAGHCSLAITPCATVEHTKDLRMFDRVMERFPQASFLRDHQAFSYCGFPAMDNEGRVIAVTCLLDNKPHEFSKEEQDLLRIFGQRIAVEIERGHHVAEQKHAADELRRSHTFIRQIVDTDPNFIFAKDRVGRFTLVNQAVADAYGTTVDQLIGKTDADFNSNPDEVESFRLKDLEVMDSLQERFISEEAITDSTGRIRWLQTVKRPILDEHGCATMMLGASTDITERKRIEETLRQREHDLRAALDERERISQDLHDGILQSLFAVGLTLETSKSLMSPRTRKTSGSALDQAIKQLNLVMREIRNFIAGLGSDLLQGKDLPTALQNMLASLTENQSTRVRLVVEDRAAKAVSVEQAFHLFRVIQESVSNCIRHGRAQKAMVSLKMLKQGVRLSIRDNGRGFNPDAAKRTGHGLGNMAARAQKIGGRFTVLSKVNEGTRIVLDIPKEVPSVSR